MRCSSKSRDSAKLQTTASSGHYKGHYRLRQEQLVCKSKRHHSNLNTSLRAKREADLIRSSRDPRGEAMVAKRTEMVLADTSIKVMTIGMAVKGTRLGSLRDAHATSDLLYTFLSFAKVIKICFNPF